MMTTSLYPSVLFVDDEPRVTAGFERMFRGNPFNVFTTNSPAVALDMLQSKEFAVVVSDECMPAMAGTEFLSLVRQQHPGAMRIILTGSVSVESMVRAVNDAAVFRLLQKPCNSDELLGSIHAALEARSMQKEAAQHARRAVETEQLTEIFELALGSLWIAVQPVVMPGDHRVFAFEALLRTEERRIPHPGAFLEAAERLGRVRDLERRIRLKIAEFAGTLPDGASLLVNLHPTSLEDPQLSSDADPLHPFAARIILEITERAALHDLIAARDQVALLRSCGYRIAVDDLGAGYAGLTSVAALSPDLVKLDMSLVRDIDKSPSRAKLVSGLTAIARDMEIGVVAEGVETDAELDRLRGFGCEIFQGYRFAKPGRPYPDVRW